MALIFAKNATFHFPAGVIASLWAPAGAGRAQCPAMTQASPLVRFGFSGLRAPSGP